MKVAIVDYSMGNLGSVIRALAELGADAFIAGRPGQLAAAERIVLPGVGSFADGMAHLAAHGWTEALALREGNAIFRIDLTTCTLHHLAGTGRSGYAGDGGQAKMALLAGPKGVSLSPAGDLYFADTESHTIRVLRTKSGIVETVIGNGLPGDGPDGAALDCHLNRPHGVFVSSDGWLYVGDSSNHRVRRLKVE